MRRGKAKAAASTPNGSQATTTDDTPEDDTIVDMADEQAPPPPPPAAESAPVSQEPTRAPAPPALQPRGPGEAGGDEYSVTNYLDLGDLFTTPRNASEEERQRMAAADFQAAIAPAFAGMEGPPPAAATPEDAVREFVEATGEARPDPGAQMASDIYNSETTALYRLRRHFLKGVGRPQPGWTPPPGLGPPS